MRVPLSWLAEVVPAAASAVGRDVGEVARRLTRAGFEVERVETVGAVVSGVVVGSVVSFDAEPQKNGKTVRWCQVSVGPGDVRGIVCGALNFAVGDKVAAALPGARLPGMEIAARKTYGHVSDGMLCSATELGLGSEHDGILILPADAPVGSDATAVLGVRPEHVLDLAITPDRGYALSMRGVGRETAIAWDVPFNDPVAALEPPALASGHPVAIEDPNACDRYVARAVTGLDPAASTPPQLARRLELTGVRPISLAVDVTNYVMMLLGQPLHAFDHDTVRGPVVVRRAVAGEQLRTLDGVLRDLDPEDLVIADDSGPIALGGVMGGAATEVTPTTRSVLIEAAHFDPVVVTRSARRHGLPSEASRRFERGVDRGLAPSAAELAVRLLVEHGGAMAAVGGTDVHSSGPSRVISLPVDATGRKAGRDYARDIVQARLRDVGCVVADDGGTAFEVVPPTWRPDLTGPADLTEEVIRLEGYETLPSLLPRAVPGRGLTQRQRARRSFGRALAYQGLAEVVIPPFLGRGQLTALGLSDDDERLRASRVANPLSEDSALLRTTLLPGLLEAAARNVGRGSRDVGLFEIGHVFRGDPSTRPPAPAVGVLGPPTDAERAALDAALPEQPLRAAAVLTGSRPAAGWDGPGRVVSWAAAVECARAVAAAVGLHVDARADPHAPWHPGQCAALEVGPTVIGHAGLLHPLVARDHGLPSATAVMEISLDALTDLAGDGFVSAPAVSPYPPVVRDIALVVPTSTPSADVADTLAAGAGPLLESLRLFDDYTGDQLTAGLRSLAFRLVFRAADRTLTDEDANHARDAAVRAAAATGASLRR